MSKAGSPAERPVARRNVVVGAALAGLIAALGWVALGIEFDRSIRHSLSAGRSWPQALFLYFRFFTIITNIGVAALMTSTALRLVQKRKLALPRIYNGALVYSVVTCATYEFMLRSQWRPQGLQFVTDMTIHDIVPALVLLFWFGFAPRRGARWRDALAMLAYPAGYFLVTLVAGALGQGYPYGFLDVGKLGALSVAVTAAVFLLIFYAAGLTTTALSMAWASPPTTIRDDRSREV
jgi:hypothetical protein